MDSILKILFLLKEDFEAVKKSPMLFILALGLGAALMHFHDSDRIEIATLESNLVNADGTINHIKNLEENLKIARSQAKKLKENQIVVAPIDPYDQCAHPPVPKDPITQGEVVEFIYKQAAAIDICRILLGHKVHIKSAKNNVPNK